MAICKLCGKDFNYHELFKHRWAVHREECLAVARQNMQRGIANKLGGPDGAGHGEGQEGKGVAAKAGKPGDVKTPAFRVATSIEDANMVAIVPRRIEISSVFLWQAREVAIREWGWPPDISVEDFVDTYFYLSYKCFGVLLGAYQLIRREDGHKEDMGRGGPTA